MTTLNDLIDLLSQSRNVMAYNKAKAIKQQLLKLAENTPNDMEFGSAVRKLLNN